MIENQLVTKEQLEEGLRYQAKVKKLIGQILVELGYIKEDTLLDFLEGVFYGYKTAPAQQPVKIFSDVDELLASDFEKWLIFMVNKNASDLHLIAGAQPQLRVNGELMSVNVEPLSADNVKTLAYSILDYEEIAGLEQNRALDKSFEIKGLSRYRLNLHWQKDSVGISVRALPLHIPAFAELGIPEVLKEFVTRPSGLVLVTGPAGCGKSTTMAAMIEYINLTRRLHVVTIEDPIEYVFVSKKGLIRQRELGTDTLSFKEALKSVVRQDPNIIFIGEMRDLETIQSALSLAETGHLVLSTLHTQDAVHSVNRIVDVFPMSHQHEVRTKLSLALQAVVVQQLIPRADRHEVDEPVPSGALRKRHCRLGRYIFAQQR
ncbi:MAG: PilT/PilU family type 4a pilus ATPase [Candidatus Omnitrophica bacterium]|nr:PilT/PilU family type 4a pilus ATPase [Candidatus Omnitrophota bacterium]